MTNDIGKHSKTVILAAIGIVSLTVVNVLAPIVRDDTRAADQAKIIERLARLEECTIRLAPLPEKVSEIAATMRAVQESGRRVELKLDSHIDRPSK